MAPICEMVEIDGPMVSDNSGVKWNETKMQPMYENVLNAIEERERKRMMMMRTKLPKPSWRPATAMATCHGHGKVFVYARALLLLLLLPPGGSR